MQTYSNQNFRLAPFKLSKILSFLALSFSIFHVYNIIQIHPYFLNKKDVVDTSQIISAKLIYIGVSGHVRKCIATKFFNYFYHQTLYCAIHW
jgi:hypothetical protein